MHLTVCSERGLVDISDIIPTLNHEGAPISSTIESVKLVVSQRTNVIVESLHHRMSV